MGYYAYYGFEDGRELKEGDELASGDGWVNWGEWVLEQDDCTECQTLYIEGWGMVDGLAKELERLAEMGDEDQKHITARILEAVHDSPTDATVIVVSNGVASDEEDDEEEDDE